jgi:hypothetical protein
VSIMSINLNKKYTNELRFVSFACDFKGRALLLLYQLPAHLVCWCMCRTNRLPHAARKLLPELAALLS